NRSPHHPRRRRSGKKSDGSNDLTERLVEWSAEIDRREQHMQDRHQTQLKKQRHEGDLSPHMSSVFDWLHKTKWITADGQGQRSGGVDRIKEQGDRVAKVECGSM